MNSARRLDNNTETFNDYEILARLSADRTGLIKSSPEYVIQKRTSDVCSDCMTIFQNELPTGYTALAMTKSSSMVNQAESLKMALCTL